MAIRSGGLQSDGDFALPIFDRICDELASDEPEGNARNSWYAKLSSINDEDASRTLAGGHARKIVTKAFKVFLELDAFDVVQSMQVPMDAPDCGDTIGRNSQLRGRLSILSRPALYCKQACD